MKSALTIITAILVVGQAMAQTDETVSLGGGYANTVYYNLNIKKQSKASTKNWDIAVAVGDRSGSAIINDGAGGQAWEITGDPMDVFGKSVDTSEIVGKTLLYNSTTSWDKGALNLGNDGRTGDFGWGTYNPADHVIYGKKVFLVRSASQTLHQVFIKELRGTKYTIGIANWNGQNMRETIVDKMDFSGNIFIYVSFDKADAVEQEPGDFQWDIAFGRYVEEIQPNFPYTVTGVRSNGKAETAQYTGENPKNATYIGLEFSKDIGIIGHDWKEFANNQWSLAANAAYFVKTAEGNIFRIVFTGFSGSQTGNVSMNIEQMTTSGIEEKTSGNTIHPNPASSFFTMDLNNSQGGTLSIIDMLGQIQTIKDVPIGTTNLTVSTEQLTAGNYSVVIRQHDGISQKYSLFVVK